MISVEVQIVGVTPYLMHRFGDEASLGKPTRNVIADTMDPRMEAEKSAYRAPDGTYYFSAFAITHAMGTAGGNHKMKGSRKTLRFVVPSAVRIALSDTITLLNGDGKTPAANYEVDARPVQIPATKGRIMRYRPRFDAWSASFGLVINETMLSVENAHMLLREAGDTIGIGDFRPEKRGPFGTFRVTRFEEMRTTKEERAS